MSKYNKTIYLERDKQFWEITVEGSTTQVRAGKINCKGRKFGLKCHKTENEAAEFATCHANGKIVEGFVDPAEKSALKRSLSSFRMERRKSFQRKLEALPPPEQMYKMPHKKRASIRKLIQQETVIIPSPVQEPSPDEPQKIRKPPRKQTTIRRNAKTAETARQSSLAQRLLKAQITAKSSRTLSKMPTLIEEKTKLSRAPTLQDIKANRSSKLARKQKSSISKASERIKLASAPTLQAITSDQSAKSVKKQKSKALKTSVKAKRQSTVMMPTLVTQETMPVGELNGVGSDPAHDIRMKRKCRSYSMSAMPQTVVMRKK